MSRIYDNWEKLMGAIMRREQDRQLAYCESLSSSSSTDISSRFSFQITFAGDVDQPANAPNLSSSNILLPSIEYEEIRKATEYFHRRNLLSEGSFSSVYKGCIDEHWHSLRVLKPGFGIPVAVKIKKMKESNDIKLQKKCLEETSHLRHPNLVTPIGYCFNSYETILVYEFMPKGSRDNHLFRNNFHMEHRPSPWAKRIKVAVGLARGLAFLHSLETPVIYGNFMIADILLDFDFNAKLWDIGLPKGDLSTKCDVCSFGVVLVQLVSGLRDIVRNPGDRVINVIDWAIPYLKNKKRLPEIMDSRLNGEYPLKQAWKVARLALQCVNYNPRSRPTMADVVAALQQL